MREVLFIKQNKEKWADIESSLLGKNKMTPDELSHAYIQLLNDLSFSQTYYPKSKTTDYLNFLVSQIYRKIYKTRRMEHNRLLYFFKEEVPLIAYQYKKQIYFAFALFFFFTFVGVISAKIDQTFVRIILGDNYVDMTLNNIKNGDPMAVYKSHGQLEGFIGITANNIYVALRAFLYGITGGILTFYIALYNGVMLGAFQYFFYEYGVFGLSLQAIWLHGAMEIFSIVIATAAGFILASSILFPKTYSRKNSFSIGVKESAKLFVSLVPFFIVAGFIEGFFTRYYKTMPLWLDVMIILGTLSFISFYFLIYPNIVHKKMTNRQLSE